jgi:hypothetical protein
VSASSLSSLSSATLILLVARPDLIAAPSSSGSYAC